LVTARLVELVSASARLLLLLFLVQLVACSINPPLQLSPLVTRDRYVLTKVPFFAQTEYQCGPAALAGLLGASGVATTTAALSPQVYLPGKKGTLQLELVAAVRRAGRIPYQLDPTPDALLAQLEAGSPVLVFQNVRTRDFPVWHYAVLVGFDVSANRLYLNSGQEEGLSMAAPAFLRTWDWAGRWALVALQPGQMPAGVERSRYFDAVVDFEAVSGVQPAVPAWAIAAKRWPEQPLPYLALGNAALDRGDRTAAVGYYREGWIKSPQDAALNNNLATVLGELGCPRSAEDLLRPVSVALPSGSPWRNVMQETLSELALLPGDDRKKCAIFKLDLH
jgi:hypothetical protein